MRHCIYLLIVYLLHNHCNPKYFAYWALAELVGFKPSIRVTNPPDWHYACHWNPCFTTTHSMLCCVSSWFITVVLIDITWGYCVCTLQYCEVALYFCRKRLSGLPRQQWQPDGVQSAVSALPSQCQLLQWVWHQGCAHPRIQQPRPRHVHVHRQRDPEDYSLRWHVVGD